MFTEISKLYNSKSDMSSFSVFVKSFIQHLLIDQAFVIVQNASFYVCIDKFYLDFFCCLLHSIRATQFFCIYSTAYSYALLIYMVLNIYRVLSAVQVDVFNLATMEIVERFETVRGVVRARRRWLCFTSRSCMQMAHLIR